MAELAARPKTMEPPKHPRIALFGCFFTGNYSRAAEIADAMTAKATGLRDMGDASEAAKSTKVAVKAYLRLAKRESDEGRKADYITKAAKASGVDVSSVETAGAEDKLKLVARMAVDVRIVKAAFARLSDNELIDVARQTTGTARAWEAANHLISKYSFMLHASDPHCEMLVAFACSDVYEIGMAAFNPIKSFGLVFGFHERIGSNSKNPRVREYVRDFIKNVPLIDLKDAMLYSFIPFVPTLLIGEIFTERLAEMDPASRISACCTYGGTIIARMHVPGGDGRDKVETRIYMSITPFILEQMKKDGQMDDLIQLLRRPDFPSEFVSNVITHLKDLHGGERELRRRLKQNDYFSHRKQITLALAGL